MAHENQQSGKRTRNLVRRAHLWLGLSVGLLFAVLGLTGSALVFYTGVDAALHPEIRGKAQSAGSHPPAAVWEQALATGAVRWHDPQGRWTFEVAGGGAAIPARYYPGTDLRGRRLMLWFSPDGRRIVRQEEWGGYLMSWIYQLHEQVLAGKLGRQIVGWSGVGMLLLLLSGIYAWWPRGELRKALAYKRNAAPIRRVRDLHKLSGLGSMLLLTVLVATGVLIALPEATKVVLSPEPVPAPVSTQSTKRSVTIGQALSVAQRALPEGELTFFDVPSAAELPIRARFRVPGDPHARFPSSFVFVDQASGRVLAVRDIRHASFGTRAASWLRALHDGSVGGTLTRIVTVLVGLLPSTLFVTGLLHWRRRTAATRERSRPSRSASPSSRSRSVRGGLVAAQLTT